MEVKKMGVEGRSGRNAGPVIFTNPRVTSGRRQILTSNTAGPKRLLISQRWLSMLILDQQSSIHRFIGAWSPSMLVLRRRL